MPSKFTQFLRRGSKTPSESSAPDDLPQARKKPSLPGLRRGFSSSATSEYVQTPPAIEALPPPVLSQQSPTPIHQAGNGGPDFPPPTPILTVEAPSPPVKPKTGGSAFIANAQHPPPSPLRQPPTPDFSPDTIPEEVHHRQEDQPPSERLSRAPPSPPETAKAAETVQAQDYFSQAPSMAIRKLWIKRPGASATSVKISSEDLVDDVRDMVLRKYGNSLGRNFDAPDVTLRIMPRERGQHAPERPLEPEEPVFKLLDAYYPGGQNIDEALIIEIPRKRTPLPSPRLMTYPQQGYFEASQPLETGTDYFPPMPALQQHVSDSHVPQSATHAPSMSILTHGRVPVLPSPRERRLARPQPARNNTSSPTTASQGGQASSSAQHRRQRPETEGIITSPPPSAPPIPTPPAGAETPNNPLSGKDSTPPVDGLTSPRSARLRKGARKSLPVDSVDDRPLPGATLAPSKLQSVAPPINVLIVEDNPINLKFMETFAKSLKVRWATAVNGKEALDKWRMGGFHLIFMDLQMPIMSGLEATKEIRRLERYNAIGVFGRNVSVDGARTPTPADRKDSEETNGSFDDVRTIVPKEAQEDDKLPKDLFLSPVIIVALTASSLESDRHEALAAGCNDFLTKVGSSIVITNANDVARASSVARTQGYRMGLHASIGRFRRLASVEEDCR